MTMQREKVLELVYASIETINEQKENIDDRLELAEGTRLFGRQSRLDSLGLVTLIIEIEERLNDEVGLEVSLVDEKAMSQSRSPFRDVKSLVDYICFLGVQVGVG